jgi:hypothetical protein
MDVLKPSRRRIVGLASLTCSLAFIVLGVAGAPVGAQSAPTLRAVCPVLSLGNPNPGDDLIPGGYFISGSAFDPSATSGSGVSRVDLFLGERESGGTFLGSGIPGTGNAGDPRSFTVKVTIPDENRGLNFAAYAVSASSGLETAVTFPVLVGVPPAKNPAATPTPVPMVENVTSSCSGASGAVSSAPAAPAAAGTPAAPAAATAATSTRAVSTAGASCPVLSLGNPNPGDNLITGDMFISGTAFDPAATSGSGITRVDLFLGERDTGGLFIGSATTGTSAGGDPHGFTIKVSIPSGINRGLDFAAYAVSALTGQETTVTFPVFVGVIPAKNPAATPTPIPTTETVTNTCSAHM